MGDASCLSGQIIFLSAVMVRPGLPINLCPVFAGHKFIVGRDLIFQNTSEHPGSLLMNI